MPAVRTPEASRPTRRIAVPRCSLPRRGIGSATSITFDFGAIYPFTCVPACNLSVYASQWLLPDTTQDSIRGRSGSGFAASRHPRRLNSTRLQGANRVTGGSCPPPVPTERGVRFLLRFHLQCPAPRSSTWFTALSLLFVPGPFPWSASSSLCIEGCLSLCMEPMSPPNDHLPLTASPCGRLSRPPSTISQSDFRPVVGPSLPWRLVGSYRLAPEPDGSPLFTSSPSVACQRYEPRKRPGPLAISRYRDAAFPVEGSGRPLRSRSISGLSLRSLAFRPATFLSSLRSGCYQTPRKT